MDRSTKQKVSKETQTLNDAMDQLDLTDTYRTFHPKTMNFTFFSSAHGTFSRIGHILGHKSSLGKFQKITIISSIFSDHNAVRLDVNYRKMKVKVAQLCPTLCNSMDFTIHRILQARILEWVTVPFSRDFPNPGIKPRSPSLQADSLPAEPQGKPTKEALFRIILYYGPVL